MTAINWRIALRNALLFIVCKRLPMHDSLQLVLVDRGSAPAAAVRNYISCSGLSAGF